MTDEQALALVTAAQDGDHRAQSAVALHCYEKYRPRVWRLVTDQVSFVLGRDDAESIFFEGCMCAVLIVDERGDPLYHVGQRGIWAVQSAVRAARAIAQRHAARWKEWDQDGDLNPVDQLTDVRAATAYERVDDRLDAEQRVRVLTTAPLKAPLRRAVEAIASGAAGDPRDLGFNARLAAVMGVSPQRASQITKELRGVAA